MTKLAFVLEDGREVQLPLAEGYPLGRLAEVTAALHEVEEKEDIYYVLTYEPSLAESKGKVKIELPGHPWFLATQFHPEFTSNPRDGHPLFSGFIRAARDYKAGKLPVAAGA